MNDAGFAVDFSLLTGHAPMPWQVSLYERFSHGIRNVPDRCDIPTGLGKTSVIAIWLIALARHPETMPRRLVYVVNRRTVVDQTTDEENPARGVTPRSPSPRSPSGRRPVRGCRTW